MSNDSYSVRERLARRLNPHAFVFPPSFEAQARAFAEADAFLAAPAPVVPEEVRRALASGDEAVFCCACAYWVRTILAATPSKPVGDGGEASAPPAGGGVVDTSGMARLHERECDALMQIIHALGDLSEPWIEGAGEAAASGEKDHERRDMRVNNILTGAGNSLMALIRDLGPQDYFPQTRPYRADPRLLTAARDHIDSLERRLSLAAAPAAPAPAAGGEREIADPELSALAEAASAGERAYGILWRLTAFDADQIGYAHDARKALLASMDKEGQRRGIAWATRHYGPLGPNPRFMLSDEDRMEMGL